MCQNADNNADNNEDDIVDIIIIICAFGIVDKRRLKICI